MVAPGAAREARGSEIRRTPHVGDRVSVVYLAALETATISAVHDDGRRVEVCRDHGGPTLEFTLSRSTAWFTSARGLRLRWGGE
jgi:hypothetical protein